MRRLGMTTMLLGSTVLFAALPAALQAKAPPPVRKAVGLEKRVLWTSSKVVGTPDPPSPYTTRVAFPTIKFFEPLAIATVPGSDRFAVAERPGKIYTFSTGAKQSKQQLLVDVGRVVYGLVFHPKFDENGYFYVSSVLDRANPAPEGSRVSRFQVTDKKTMRADPKSENIILRWPSGGHNGGCLRFGPDGYLYLSTGDGSGIADLRKSGQDLSDLLGSILRLDVDRPAKGKAYSIPKDNPFIDMPGARPEIWAYGLRQAWKFSFDPERGDIWAGEIGQDLWESVHRITRGGNYGWSVMEGSHPFRPERKKGPTPILKPVLEHPHSEARSIVGGFVYRGSRLKQLRGAYIYGDYDTGKIWAMRYDGAKVTLSRELADTQLRIIAWVEDASRELYLLDFVSGKLYQLAPSPPPAKDAPQFPRKLSETGLFASTKAHRPAPGLIPYSVNSPLWSDGAEKERFIAIPGDGKIERDTVVYPQPAPGSRPGWRFPDGTVLVKTFSLEMEAGNPASRRRLETRLLHFKHMPGTDEYGAQFWRGYTYVWNDEQTDATLLASEGLNREYTVKDPEAPGGVRKQNYRFPSRAECTLCHTMSAKYALGVNTLQMNKDHDYGGVVANQLKTLEHLGLFTDPLDKQPEQQEKLVDHRDASQSLDARARAYLHSNCSHCHRKWGGGNAEFQLLDLLPLEETGTLGVRPAHGKFKLDDPHLLVPGSPERSMIYHRLQKLGLGRMPHIGSNVVDRQAVELIGEWIKSMPAGGK